MNYRYVIEAAAFRTLLACAPRERRMLAESLNRLAENPFNEPDLKDTIEGREVSIRFFGTFTVIYWLDHAVKEVRVILIYKD